jgi:hypothetical protein
MIRNTDSGTELTMMRWGMPPPPRTGGPPVTNIRNTSSPHWRGWLKPENRCLVPFNSFAEYAPELVYEVTLKGTLEDDPDHKGTGVSFACRKAKTIAIYNVLPDVVLRNKLQMHALKGAPTAAREAASAFRRETDVLADEGSVIPLATSTSGYALGKRSRYPRFSAEI